MLSSEVLELCNISIICGIAQGRVIPSDKLQRINDDDLETFYSGHCIVKLLYQIRIKSTALDTQQDVADYVGVSEGTVSRWESGDIGNMRRDRIVAYANVLCVSPAVIMGWEDVPDSHLYSLTAAERDIIDAYRSADPLDRAMVRRVLGLQEKEAAAESVS